MTVVITPMSAEDASRCAELEQLLFPGENPWSADAFRAELRQPHNHYVVARDVAPRDVSGPIVGYAGIVRLGRASDPENEVHTIGVDPARQRRGIGRLLLDALLVVADAHGGDTWLEVRTDNDAAQELYRETGFVVVGTRPHYYQPSGADAFSMRRLAPASRGEQVQR
ncbi:MAG: ribosomal protein S18-alanine N-acetyltransferase [Mycobacteriaceae bacterium]